MQVLHFKYSLLLVLCYLLFPLVNIAQRLPIQEVKYQHEDFTLPGVEVLSAFQDRDGFLWLYIEGVGIVRYDGQEMEVSQLGKDFKFFIAELNILQDSKGYLWVIRDNGGVFVSDESVKPNTAIESLTFSSGFSGGSSHNWQSDKNGDIWTTASSGLLRYRRDAEEELVVDTFMFQEPIVNGRARSYKKSFSCTLDGGVWISTDKERSKKVLFSEKGKYEIVDSVKMSVQLEDANGGIWGYKGREIFYRDSEKKVVKKSEGFGGKMKIQNLTDESILVLYSRKGGGIERISRNPNNQKLYQSDSDFGIPYRPYDLLVGKQNTWISHEKGLALLPNDFSAFTTYQFSEEKHFELDRLLHLPNESFAFASFPNHSKPHLIAHGLGKLYFFTQEFHRIGIFDLPYTRMPSTPDDSLYLNAPASWIKFNEKGNIEGYNFHSGYYNIDLQNAFRAIIKQPKSLENNELFEAIIGNYYKSVGIDFEEILQEPNLKKLFPLTWEGETYDASTSPILCYYGNLWATVEDGIFVFNTIQFTPTTFIPIEDTPCGIVSTNSKIWVGSSKGIWQIDPINYQIEKQIIQKDGLTYDRGVGDCLSLDKDSVLYFLTHQRTRGYARTSSIEKYNPKWDKAKTESLPIHLKKADYQENNWGNNELNIKYVGLSYRDPFSLRYRTRLKGYEKDWSAATKEQSIRYTNLGAFLFPKTYQFEVMAKDYRNIWHEMETPYTFQVKPTLPLRWWAFLLYTALLFFSIRWYVRNRLKQQIRNQKLQEAEVIKTQRDEIAQKNAQNELLLKEIHHRVKNNLETVSSLLELQSAQVEDDEVQSVMQASQSRVQSMSILHQKLYQGKDLASIEMKDYFKNLTESILDTYDAWEKVEVEYEMDEIELDVDTAIPIGLIVNELITNSLKYAFPDKQKGRIVLNLQKIDKKIKLSIQDNGIGLQEKASSPVSGFGSQLIQLLVSQIRGTMTTRNQDGLNTTIDFPLGNSVTP